MQFLLLNNLTINNNFLIIHTSSKDKTLKNAITNLQNVNIKLRKYQGQ